MEPIFDNTYIRVTEVLNIKTVSRGKLRVVFRRNEDQCFIHTHINNLK